MTTVQLRPWTVDEYHRLIEAGILTADDSVELLEGQIVKMSPHRPPHAAVIYRASEYLREQFGREPFVRVQLPVSLPPNSEPEPDVAVVQAEPGYYGTRHPGASDVLLLIEVSDTTLAYDRTQKAAIYARAGIADYWILDINSKQLIVMRQPGPTGYLSQGTLSESDTIAPLALPEIRLSVGELLI